MRSTTFIFATTLGFLAALFMGCGGGSEAPDMSSVEGDVEAGKAVYMKRCSQCHGLEGKGDGPAAGFMLPRPRIFYENKDYKFRTTPDGEIPTDRDLFNIISRGLPGTAMPGFEVLPEQERWDVVAFIKSLAEEDFFDEEAIERAEPLEELANPAPPEITDEVLARGKEIFVESQCAKCHGEEGRGNGSSWPDLKDTWKDPACKSDKCAKTPILPANLTVPEHFRGGESLYDVFRLLSTGPTGSAMPLFNIEEPSDRWALAAYVLSLAPAKKEARDEVIRANRVDELPSDGGDEAWKDMPIARFETLANVVEPPRLFWTSVQMVMVQAAYTEKEMALRVQWDDRSNSKGNDLTTEYKDRDTTVYGGTKHPDQIAIQFPARIKDPAVRPYFMLGDRKRGVNLWWWQAHNNELVERNAKGFNDQKTQPESSQDIKGEVTYEDGRYTMIVRRNLETADKKNDVQFGTGKFIPIAFNIWDGDRGELGQRRNLTTWYWLQFKPPIPEHVKFVSPATFAGSFILLMGLFTLIRRRKNSEQ